MVGNVVTLVKNVVTLVKNVVTLVRNVVMFATNFVAYALETQFITIINHPLENYNTCGTAECGVCIKCVFCVFQKKSATSMHTVRAYGYNNLKDSFQFCLLSIISGFLYREKSVPIQLRVRVPVPGTTSIFIRYGYRGAIRPIILLYTLPGSATLLPPCNNLNPRSRIYRRGGESRIFVW